MPISYTRHGGNHQVSVVYCPALCRDRLIHLSQDASNSWAVPDFIVRRMIRNAPPSNARTSDRTLAQIEAEVTYSEAPPFHSVEHVGDWAIYLRLRTMVVLRRDPDGTPPNPQFGDWQPM